MDNNKTVSFHSKAFVCVHVFENVKSVLWVSRANDDWCFSCGEQHPNGESTYRVIEIGHLLAKYPDLNVLLDLLPNAEAERSAIGKPWIRTDLVKNNEVMIMSVKV